MYAFTITRAHTHAVPCMYVCMYACIYVHTRTHMQYRQGHPVAVDYVDRARVKVRQIMGRRSGGAYEQL